MSGARPASARFTRPTVSKTNGTGARRAARRSGASGSDTQESLSEGAVKSRPQHSRLLRRNSLISLAWRALDSRTRLDPRLVVGRQGPGFSEHAQNKETVSQVL